MVAEIVLQVAHVFVADFELLHFLDQLNVFLRVGTISMNNPSIAFDL